MTMDHHARKSALCALFVALGLLCGSGNLTAAAINVAPTQSDSLVTDSDGDGKADRGDVLRYDTQIGVSGSVPAATGMQFDADLGPNLLLQGGTIEVSPLALPDAYTAIGNTQLSVGAPSGVLANDRDPDGDPLTVVGADTASALGGTVAVNADGSFTYLPPVGMAGDDTFSYTIGDGTFTDNTTVTVTVSNMVWYVQNNSAPGGDGRSTQPFDTLVEAQGVSGIGHTIHVAQGDGTTNGQNTGIVLKSGQRLIGSGVALVVDSQTLIPASARPQITSASGHGVVLANGCEVAGVNVRNTAGNGIVGTSLSGTQNLHDLEVNSASSFALNFGSMAGTITVQSVTLNNGPDGIRMGTSPGVTLNVQNTSIQTTIAGRGINVSGGGTITVGGGSTINATGGAALDISGAAVNLNFASLVSANSTAQGVVLNSCSGTLVTPTTTISGCAQSGIEVANCPSVSFDFGTVNMTAPCGTSGNAIWLNNNAGASLTFAAGGAAISSANGGGLRATNSGTVSLNGIWSFNATNGPALYLQSTRGYYGGSPGWQFAGLWSMNSPVEAVYLNSLTDPVTVTGYVQVTGSNNQGIKIDTCAGNNTIASALVANCGDSGGALTPGLDGIYLLNNTGSFTLNGGYVNYTTVPNNHGIRIEGCTGAVTIQAAAPSYFSINGVGSGTATGFYLPSFGNLGVVAVNSGNLTMDRVQFQGVGEYTGTDDLEHALYVRNPRTGAVVSVTNGIFNNIPDGAGFRLDADNVAGTLNVTFSNNTLTNIENGVEFSDTTNTGLSSTSGGRVVATLNANSFSLFRDAGLTVGDGIMLRTAGNLGTAGQSSFTITNNTVSDPPNNAIDFTTRGSSASDLTIQGNNLDGIVPGNAGVDPLIMGTLYETSVLDLIVRANQIRNTPDAGIDIAAFGTNSATTMNCLIENHAVFDNCGTQGILIETDDASVFNVRVHNNTITNCIQPSRLGFRANTSAIHRAYVTNNISNAGYTLERDDGAGNGRLYVGCISCTPVAGATNPQIQTTITNNNNTPVGLTTVTGAAPADIVLGSTIPQP